MTQNSMLGTRYLVRPGRAPRKVLVRSDGRIVGAGDDSMRWVTGRGTLTITSARAPDIELVSTGNDWHNATLGVGLFHNADSSPEPQIPVNALPSVKRSLPCSYKGDLLSGAERNAMGLSHGPSWARCGHPDAPLGPVVCSCRGCGPKCAGYTSAPPRAILITGGIGDALALESMMGPADRDALEEIYYACPAAFEIESLFRAMPGFPNLTTHTRLKTGAAAYYTINEVTRKFGAFPTDVADWSIRAVFPEHRPFVGSSLLTKRVSDIEIPSRPYVVICPSSNWGSWADRVLSPADWRACLQFLETHDLLGIVLGRGSGTAPTHERLDDRQGRTTITEAVELLKGAGGYIGIDTCWSVLAAQLFPSHRLAVKSVQGHLYRHIRTYYAPYTAFPFVQRKLVTPQWTT